jgi:hypothetical protein
VSFIIPFQLSPVATRNNVRNAIPKLLKWACSPRPWHGYFSLHSGWNNGESYSWHKNHTLNTFIVIIIPLLTLQQILIAISSTKMLFLIVTFSKQRI